MTLACSSETESATSIPEPPRSDGGIREAAPPDPRREHDAGAGGESSGAPADGGSSDAGGSLLPGDPKRNGQACNASDPDAAAASGESFTAPTRLTSDDAIPLGVTTDGHVVARGRPSLVAVPLIEGGEPIAISERAGNVRIEGRVVFQWSNVDYSTGRGDLMIWSAPDCRRDIERTLLTEDFVKASADGSFIVFARTASEDALDLVVASRDLAEERTLVSGVGYAGEDTCRPHYGFVSGRIFVGWCPKDSREANIDLFERSESDDDWTVTRIAERAQPSWATDASGERVVYITASSVARLWEGEDRGEIDRGVGWRQVLPDGSAVLYAVGDQLRRTPLPNTLPIPVVTNRFAQVGAWSPDYRYVVYSSTVEYERGERRDLLLTPTTAFNPSPHRLVATPEARLSRSVFTDDGDHVLYLTGTDATGRATLHVQPTAGGPARSLRGVDTVVAAHEGWLVFSNNRSDPERYPVVADLNVFDANAGGDPILLQSRVVDGRSFVVTPDKRAVVYTRPPGEEADTAGLWAHPLPE